AIHLGPDGDGDGIPDACDCAPADAGSYDAPGEVSGLVFAADGETLSWVSLARADGSGTLYDALRGDLAALRSGVGIGSAACLAPAATASSIADAEAPAEGSGYYYVVQGRNGCGDGGWGAASDGTPRSHGACP